MTMTRFLGLWSLFSYLAATAAFTPPTRGTSHRQSTTTALAETPKKVVYVENPQVDAGGVAKAFAYLGAAGAALGLIVAPALVDLPAPSASSSKPASTRVVKAKKAAPVQSSSSSADSSQAAAKRAAERKAQFEAKRAAIEAKKKAEQEAAAAAKAAKKAAKTKDAAVVDEYAGLLEKTATTGASVAAPVSVKAKAEKAAAAPVVVDVGATAASLKDELKSVN